MSSEEVHRLRERVKMLEGEQKQTEAVFASTFRLTPPSLKLLILLYKLPSATSTVIAQRLGISDVKVAVFRLRQQLAKQGHDVKIESHRGVGYWLDDASRNVVKALITPASSTPAPTKPEQADLPAA